MKCKICGKEFDHLGSHIWHAHKIKANEYKEMFGLPHKMSLISKEIKHKKREHFEANREKYLKNFLKAGKKYWFKKGERQVRGYISPYQKKQALLRIIKVNKNRKPEQCPICKVVFDNLDTHLYMKHRLLRVKDNI